MMVRLWPLSISLHRPEPMRWFFRSRFPVLLSLWFSSLRGRPDKCNVRHHKHWAGSFHASHPGTTFRCFKWVPPKNYLAGELNHLVAFRRKQHLVFIQYHLSNFWGSDDGSFPVARSKYILITVACLNAWMKNELSLETFRIDSK